MLLYRRIASADTVDAVDELYGATIARRPEMPHAARNFFDKARIKAFANERGIKTVSVVGGKLTVEPVTLSRDTVTKLRRHSARYIPASKKFSIPLRYFDVGEDDGLLDAIAGFLKELV